MAADHPGRFGFFATTPLPDVRAAHAEIAYAHETLKCEGVCLMSNYGDRYLGDPAFAPVFDDLNRRKLVVYVHPTVCSCDENTLSALQKLVPLAQILFGSDYPFAGPTVMANAVNSLRNSGLSDQQQSAVSTNGRTLFIFQLASRLVSALHQDDRPCVRVPSWTSCHIMALAQ